MTGWFSTRYIPRISNPPAMARGLTHRGTDFDGRCFCIDRPDAEGPTFVPISGPTPAWTVRDRS